MVEGERADWKLHVSGRETRANNPDKALKPCILNLRCSLRCPRLSISWFRGRLQGFGNLGPSSVRAAENLWCSSGVGAHLLFKIPWLVPLSPAWDVVFYLTPGTPATRFCNRGVLISPLPLPGYRGPKRGLCHAEPRCSRLDSRPPARGSQSKAVQQAALVVVLGCSPYTIRP